MVRGKRERPMWWLAPTLLLLFVVEFIPFVIAIWYALHAISFTDSRARGQWVGGQNFTRALTDPDLGQSIMTTVTYLVPAVGLQLLLGLGIALLIAQVPRGHKVIIPALVLPSTIPPIVVGLIGVLSFNTEFGFVGIYAKAAGILDRSPLGDQRLALPTIIAVDTWQWTPFMALILLAGLLSLPHEPFEAAEVDGAGTWQKFRYITLPLLRPHMAVALLFRAIDAFKIFDIIYIMTRGGPGRVTETVSVYAYRLTFRFWHLGYGASVVLLIFLISLIGSMLLYRTLQRESL